MTDEEMAEEYAVQNWEHYEQGQTDYKALKQAFLAGFKAGKDLAETDLAVITYMQGIAKQRNYVAKLKAQIEKAKKLAKEVIQFYPACTASTVDKAEVFLKECGE